MPTLSFTKNYAAAAVLTKAHLDAAFQSAETFFNSTKIDYTNIQTGGIATANYAALSVDAAALASDSVTTVKILDANVTTAKLASGAVTAAKITSGTITGTQITSAVNLAGVAQVASMDIVTSYVDAGFEPSGLTMIRGQVSSDGSVAIGGGFTITHVSTGVYRINFLTTFFSAPSVSVTVINVAAYSSHIITVDITSVNTTQCTFRLLTGVPYSLVDAAFCFMAIGSR